MASWQDYLKLMRSLSKTLGDLTEVEHDKNAAAARGDLRGVEECMKREQVLSLTLRGYDQKRDSLLRDLGITGVRLSTLVDHSPEELRLETKAAWRELTLAAQEAPQEPEPAELSAAPATPSRRERASAWLELCASAVTIAVGVAAVIAFLRLI